MSVTYTAGEVAFLRRLSHDDAVALTTHWMDSCAGFSADGHYSPGAGAESSDVPLIARWADVQRAIRVVEHAGNELGVQLLERRLEGATERELADSLETSQPTVHRRVRAALEQILVVLNGGYRVVQASS